MSHRIAPPSAPEPGRRSLCELRKLKANRWYWKEDPEDEHEPFVAHLYRRVLPSSEHIPNQREAKALRRLCAQSGLSPEQVRQHKAYRRVLAEAARSAHLPQSTHRLWPSFLKRLRRACNAPVWTPAFREAFEQTWDAERANMSPGHLRLRAAALSGKAAYLRYMHSLNMPPS
jgi:hypothetical protein